VAADGFPGRVTGDRLEAGIDVEDDALRVGEYNAIGHVAQDGVEPFLFPVEFQSALDGLLLQRAIQGRNAREELGPLNGHANLSANGSQPPQMGLAGPVGGGGIKGHHPMDHVLYFQGNEDVATVVRIGQAGVGHMPRGVCKTWGITCVTRHRK